MASTKSKNRENVAIDHRYMFPDIESMRPLGKHLYESPWGKYNDLPIPAGKILATYIWIDGTGENLRSKDRTLDFIPKVPKDLPIWHYNGARTGQATEPNDADMYLFPRAIYKDPFRRGNHILVMCDTYHYDFEPTVTNHRVKCVDAHEKCKELEPWFGIEQQYFLINSADMRPFGWPPGGGFPLPQGDYHCAIGADKVFARDLVEAHYRCCTFAGIRIAGINAEVAPSQWEYQVGPSVGVNAGDDLWVARYIMSRLAEEYGLIVTLDPKPVLNWSGSGAHTNFSTKQMRDDNGIVEIEKAIYKLARAHLKHIKVYDPHGGKDNVRRCHGTFNAPGLNEFTTGVGDRACSVRIPRIVHEARKGHLEDRRPSSNSDPYAVVTALLRTCILNQ